VITEVPRLVYVVLADGHGLNELVREGLGVRRGLLGDLPIAPRPVLLGLSFSIAGARQRIVADMARLGVGETKRTRVLEAPAEETQWTCIYGTLRYSILEWEFGSYDLDRVEAVMREVTETLAAWNKQEEQDG